MGINSQILDETGSSHLLEFFSWPPVTSDQKDNTGGVSLTYTVQCGSR